MAGYVAKHKHLSSLDLCQEASYSTREWERIPFSTELSESWKWEWETNSPENIPDTTGQLDEEERGKKNPIKKIRLKKGSQ